MSTLPDSKNFPYYYQAFACTIASDLELPGLNECVPCDADLQISLGLVPGQLRKALSTRKFMKMGQDFYSLTIPEVGSYYLEKGGPIIVEPDPAVDPRTIRMWLYSFCIPAYLLLSNRLPLHGSSVEIEGNAIWLTGRSGTGKSTLAANFLRNGHPLVADDLTIMEFASSGMPLAYTSTSSQNLCADTIKRFDRDKVSEHVNRGFGMRAKYSVTVPQMVQKPIPIRMVVQLEKGDIATPQLRRVQGAEKLQIWIENTYRAFMIKPFQLKAWHFFHCHQAAEHVPCYKITRPKKGYWEQELYEMIVEEYRKQNLR